MASSSAEDKLPLAGDVTHFAGLGECLLSALILFGASATVAMLLPKPSCSEFEGDILDLGDLEDDLLKLSHDTELGIKGLTIGDSLLRLLLRRAPSDFGSKF